MVPSYLIGHLTDIKEEKDQIKATLTFSFSYLSLGAVSVPTGPVGGGGKNAALRKTLAAAIFYISILLMSDLSDGRNLPSAGTG